MNRDITTAGCQDACGALPGSPEGFGLEVIPSPPPLVRPLPLVSTSDAKERRRLAQAEEAFRLFQRVSRLTREPWPTAAEEASPEDCPATRTILVTLLATITTVLAVGAKVLHLPTRCSAKSAQTQVTPSAFDSQRIVEVRMRLAAGEPLCEIEADLDRRDNIRRLTRNMRIL